MQQRDPQEFDNTLKALFGNEAKEILPQLLPETELIDDKNIEIDRTILKADLVYNILYRLEAQKFVHQRAICMYTLLPAMKGANASMLIQALHDMKEHYTRRQFGHHLIRFKRITQRSKTLLEQDKQLVEEEIRMHMAYDWFIDDNPDVQERIAKGEAKGELRALQQVVVDAVNNRFPSLVHLAQQQVTSIQKPEALRQLVLQIFSAPDETSVQQFLNAIETS